MSHIHLIVGLGNIGDNYLGTRHNAGQLLVQNFAKNLNYSLKLNKNFYGFIGRCYIQAHKIMLLYPNTAMNNSGLAVAKLVNFYQWNTEKILIVHDDLDLKCGSVRLKKFGGHGGHNGVRDVINSLGSNHFYRLRIGIGHPGKHARVSQYVLHKPSTSDKCKIERAINRAISHIDDIVKYNHQYVMNQLHKDI